MPTVRRIKSVKWDEDDLDDYYSDDYSDSENEDSGYAKKNGKFSKTQVKLNVTPKREIVSKTAHQKPVCQTHSNFPLCSPKKAVIDTNKSPNRYPLNVVVLGAVDAGKSTLLGHFLTLTNCVDKKLKNLKHLSWILDQGEDERDRGITIDPTKCQFNLSLKNAHTIHNSNNTLSNGIVKNATVYDTIKVNVIDTPGHHDLIQNLVVGAVFANAAVIIVDSNDVLKSEVFSAYFSEHMLLLYTLGIRNVIVCINKIDRFQYSEETYNRVLKEIAKLVKMYESTVTFIFMPVSALNGDNLVTKSSNLSWYKGPSLIESLQIVSLDIVKRPVVTYDKVICHIFDLWESGKSVNCSCFLEGCKLKIPIEMVSHPNSVQVKFTSAQSLPIPLVTVGDGNDVNEASSSTSYVNDFVDSVEMKGTEIANLLGTKIIVDANTHARIKNNTSSIVRTNGFYGFIYLNKMNRSKLTIGENVELFVGYSKQSAHIRSMEIVDRKMGSKKTYSIAPGQFAYVEFASNTQILVEPISRESSYISNLITNDVGKGAEGVPRGKNYDSHVGILSRLLVRSSGNFVAGGAVVASQ
ncbi:translation elongation factor 1-alpha [Theileria orientalis strain Shintoku]|uniref:Translation elongation factor 1-alpha n=1 Tax=Theileria orientalis strain Shintoku TaxID=869250 RepID=J4DQ70_THEOR|nr:translation elongation factor 1-alpha [Theileria orientalis strain Shintoku]BAM41939.1 translation elongation factor 1-alpha [Theileria orientalis strain Shintoku]|eukprot:XP_009692240.1 translation elongation factor 1-alpha [Theileria orientalis strain Shintoku]